MSIGISGLAFLPSTNNTLLAVSTMLTLLNSRRWGNLCVRYIPVV